MENKTFALLLAAGSGTRAGSGTPKQFRLINGRPLIAHAYDRLRNARIDEILIVAGADQEVALRKAVGNVPIVIGGATRQQSVRNGLERLARGGNAGIVLIHDAARAFLPAVVIDRLLDALDAATGAVPVLPIVDTLAKGGSVLGDTVNRDGLWRVQTPQAFHFDAILAAHRSWATTEDATDDAQVVRAAGHDVAVVKGHDDLEKLTYPVDFKRAEQRLRSSMISRTGMGFDVHAFSDGEDLWLGGLQIPHDRGLLGHSDADVVLHALTDALLGAAGQGDIGDHFPPSDPQWRGAASRRFVEHARDLIVGKGGIIDHADITIICEAPKIGPHRGRMRQTIADLLQLPMGRISIKATTTERLGFTGRREGIAAQAVATIRLPEDME